jgi:hypothetical protein
MALFLAPAVAIVVVGLVGGAVAAPFASAGAAAAVGRRAAWLVALAAAGAVVASFVLPRTPVMNGPIGATCPDMGSGVAFVLGALAILSMAAAAAVVATATVEGASRVATAGTFGRFALAVIVPYAAVGAWLVPALCDYS